MPSSCTAPDLDRQEEKAKITSSSKKNYFCDVSADMDLETKLHKHEKIHWNSSMGAEPQQTGLFYTQLGEFSKVVKCANPEIWVTLAGILQLL